MLSPSELKKRQFSKALRGYSAIEVDEHLDFILEKYTELYRRNDELEKELEKICYFDKKKFPRRICLSANGNDAGILGAAALVD